MEFSFSSKLMRCDGYSFDCEQETHFRALGFSFSFFVECFLDFKYITPLCHEGFLLQIEFTTKYRCA